MKREIEFKAWNKVGKFWLEWEDFIAYEKDQQAIVGNDYRVFNDDEFILCQFIGIKDKNGNKIYEGDILTHYLDQINPKDKTVNNIGDIIINYLEQINPKDKIVDNIIEWNSEILAFISKQKSGSKFYIDAKNDVYEITGNIHENKEPLK